MLSAEKMLSAPTKMEIMKKILLVPVVLAAFVLVGCDKEKAAIDKNNATAQDAINNRKDTVDAAAKDATKQADIDAQIEKARIEANKVKTQAQLDADKKKADAQAELDKAKADAEKK